MAKTFVGAFNVEVTSFPWTTPTPYPYVSPILLVFSSRSALKAVFDDMSFFPFKPWDAEDRVILGCICRLFGLSLLVLDNYSPRHGPWVLMESGSGHKFSGSTIAPQNPAVRILGRIEGFWWHQASVKTCQSLSPIGSWDSSSARDTFLEPLEGEMCLY